VVGVASRPLWRQAFDLVERAAGSRLETYVQTEGFAELLGTAEHLQARLRRRGEQLTRRAWHLINLPTGSDIHSVQAQVAGLERRLRDITSQLEALAEGDSNAADAHSSVGAPAIAPIGAAKGNSAAGNSAAVAGEPGGDARPDPTRRRAQRPASPQLDQVRRRPRPSAGGPVA
jgi:hypothetical protein